MDDFPLLQAIASDPSHSNPALQGEVRSALALIDAALAWSEDMQSSGRLFRLRQECNAVLAEREATR